MLDSGELAIGEEGSSSILTSNLIGSVFMIIEQSFFSKKTKVKFVCCVIL